MKKRILALVLCLIIAFTALPVTARGATENEVQRICDQIRQVYKKVQYSTGIWNLHGYCGIMAGWELYHLGITTVPMTQNGNEMYDLMKSTEYINENYHVDCYPASQYSIEEALNTITKCGTVDAYNIMLGFHWTNSAAGRQWGHVNVIHAILDGKVYFSEGFKTPFQDTPGQPMICTIAEFAEFYNKWTRFEGLIHFGSGGRMEGYDVYGSNLFLQAQAPISLLADPTSRETVHTVQAGERIYANAVCQDENGNTFYRIEENGQTYYTAAENLTPFLFCYDDVKTLDITLPQQVQTGQTFDIDGTVHTQNMIYAASVQVTDSRDQIVLGMELSKNSYMLDLDSKEIHKQIDLSVLEEGSYTYHVACDLVNYYYQDGVLMGDMQHVVLAAEDFTVGEAEKLSTRETAVSAKTPEQGWQYIDGKWFYYEDSVPKTGWLRQDGIHYYLLADGSAATGWHCVNGKNRYFSATGAMCTGWLKTENGTYYLLSNGVAAAGWYTVEGVLYRFGETGKLMTNTVIHEDGITYFLDPNGYVTILK